ncbi:uncharacterized protein [Parasteatoda tepidariorum]|uniref:uncharacterized protein isoform X2 n=1 Tax=Parasteatoda tepidariorum TaxID=114398 RepID=UPI00077FC4EB|nr:uncharacterized protein LOC107439001 isoform X2 [Parasteatoda tepidariorum]
MFANAPALFEVKENEIVFEEICHKLKDHPFDSPWALSFQVENENICEVEEINVPINNLKIKDDEIKPEDKLSNNETHIRKFFQIEDNIDEEKFLPLKTSLLSIQDTNSVEEIASIDLLSSLTLSQVPHFCKFIEDAVLNETSLAIFLNSISNLEKPLSITITLAIFNKIIYPKILSFKCSNYRNLSSSIMKFFMVHPKAILEGLLIPCLKEHSLETSLQEILLKVVKSNLSDEHVTYFIQKIVNEDLVPENTFLVLQTLIEKKLSEQQLKMYSDIVKANQTIMKRAAQNILKKFKLD